MTKYRIRLKNGRVVGPLKLEMFSELQSKNRIAGDEDCQLYPTGDWHKIKDFPEIIEALSRTTTTKKNTEATFIKKIDDLKKEVEEVATKTKADDDEESSEVEFFEKYKYEKKKPYIKNLPDEKIEISTEKENSLTQTKIENSDVTNNADKTIVNLDTRKYLEELKKEDEISKKLLKEEAEKTKAEKEAIVDYDNDSTQFLNLNDIRGGVLGEIDSGEKELKNEEKAHKKEILAEEKRIAKAKLDREAFDNDEYDDEEESSNPIKKKILILVAIIAVLFVIIFPDDGKKKLKKIVPIAPQINFPQRFDTPNKKLSELAHKNAIKLLKNPTYINKIKASKYLLKSAENKFNNNSALGRLIFIYSQLLDNSSTKTDDSNTIFKLVQIFKTKALVDPLYCSGIALFYLKIGKYNASVKVIEKYRDIKKGRSTLEVLAVYLRALSNIGDLIKSKAVAEKISTVPSAKRPLFVDISLIEYYFLLNNYERASKIVSDGIKKYPKSVALLLKSAKLMVYQEDFKNLGKILRKIRILEAERSKIYFSKYLEYRALEAVGQQKIKRATAFFKKALKVHESVELRARLATLGESTDNDANLLITESKSLQFVISSENYIKENNWKYAFKDALEATRIAPHYLKAKLHLASLQIKQSLFAEAINSLEALYKDDPHNYDVIFTLMDAYIEAYKFSEVKRLFSISAASEIRNYPKYFSLMAKYYVYKNDFNNAINWLQMAINKNPLDDNNIFEMAKMFIRYSKFNKAKMQLNKAMDLDPAKVQYRVSYSKILYEIDGSDAAIGYLYDVLQDFPDDPKILSQIGIYHYRSGQQKSFERIKEKLKKLPHRDTSLQEFLIKAAKLDGKNDVVIAQSKKLIELNPGNLKVRLELGKLYMDMDKYKEALLEFKSIETRLDTYPKLQYYMSKLYLLTDNVDKAIELAQKEIKANPAVEDGYVLLGDIYRKKREFIKAEKEYKKAQKINGDNVDMLLGLAIVNFKKSQYEIALDLFKKGRDLDPSRAEIHKLLADAYRKTSQSSMAIDSYKMFLELSPNSKYKDEINTYIRNME